MDNPERKSVLVVDDDPSVLKIVALALDRTEYHSEICTNAGQALDRIMKCPGAFDVILTDVRMPGNTGIDLLEKVQLLFPDIPVILMTGYADIDTTLSAIKHHAFDFILKPVDLSILVRTLDKAFEYLRLKRLENNYRLVLEEEIEKKTRELHVKVAALEKVEENERQARLGQEALRERLQLQIDRLPIGCILFDISFRVIYLNNAAEQIFGFVIEDLLEKEPFGIILPETAREPAEKLMERLKEGDQNAQSTGSCYTKDRKTIICQWSNIPICNTDGEVVNIMSMVQDITARLEAEEKLQKSEERFRQLFEQNDDAIVLLNCRDASIVDLNEQVVRLYGFSRGELMKEGPNLLFPPSDQPDLIRLFSGITHDGGLRIDKIEMVRKDGSRIFASIWGKIIMYLGGEVACFSFRDITERIQFEEEARANQAKLIHADKMSSLGLLVSGIAHEINNPNNFILFNSALLAAAWQSAMPILEDYYRENGDFSLGDIQYSGTREIIPRLFSGMVDGSKRIRSIVEKLKNFSRQDTGSTDAPVEINRVVIDAIEILNHEIKSRCENFQLNAAHDLPPARGNSQQIEQVVINLLMNALQALPDKKRAIRITTGRIENQLFITVDDEGTGMSPEVLAHVMEPFFTTKSSNGGTGLGLSISASILKDNHGSLTFSSEPGRGTTATVKLKVFG